MKTKRIDEYICIDVDKIIVDEMKEIRDGDYSHLFLDEDIEFWAGIVEAAKVILTAYEVQGDK